MSNYLNTIVFIPTKSELSIHQIKRQTLHATIQGMNAQKFRHKLIMPCASVSPCAPDETTEANKYILLKKPSISETKSLTKWQSIKATQVYLTELNMYLPLGIIRTLILKHKQLKTTLKVICFFCEWIFYLGFPVPGADYISNRQWW